MKKITQFIIGFIYIGLFFVSTSIVYAEVIQEFKSVITVLPDSSIFVEEKITYNFEDSIRHGIFRTIPLLNSKSEPIEIEVISVTDEDGNPYKFNTEIKDEILNIKIGDPDRMISGVKEYDISYRVLGSIGYYTDYDEIYWNITGNGWDVSIKKVEGRIILPTNVFPIKQDCYYGEEGSKAKCTISESGIFSVGQGLKNNEVLTIAASFPKGTVALYQPQVDSVFIKFIKTFWPVLIPIIVFVFMYARWLKKGRDPEGTGVIIPQYDIPDNLTPLEVGGIVDGEIKSKNISAEIIYLATEGYIKIRQINKKILGLISQRDYEFILLKEEGLLQNDFDKSIITAIFEYKGKVGGVSKLSALNNNFYTYIPSIRKHVMSSLLIKRYYTNFSKFVNKKIVLSWILLLSVSMFLTQFMNLQINNTENRSLIFTSSFILSVIIWLIFSQLMSAKSPKGVKIKEYLLGLKEYLQIAEKDRLHFHNAPENKPEIFERLLPYAMVFGVEELWAKEFKDIYTNPPSWYEGKMTSFNAVHFGRDMAMFSSLANSSLSSSPGSSGSGGGGSSGGGGGGGGGGSW